MKSSIEPINSVQCRLNVEIPAVEVKASFEDFFKNLQRKAHIQGFRPGKAPLSVIRRLYADHATSEVTEKLIKNHLFKAIEQETLKPIAAPMIDRVGATSEDTDFSFSAIVDLMPQLAFEDYKDVTIAVPKIEFNDQTVADELENLRRRHAQAVSVDNATVAEDHLVTFSQKASLDGQPLDKMTFENGNIVIGEDRIFPDLEKGMIGMKAGETKDITVQVPTDYADQELQNKNVTFQMTVQDIKKMQYPELNDEFAKDLQVDSLEALKTNLAEKLSAETERANRQNKENAILKVLNERHPFDVPPAMVDQVIDSMIDEAFGRNKESNAEALKDEELRNRVRPQAIQRAKNTLILWHIVQSEKLEVTDQDLDQHLEKMLGGMGAAEGGQKPDFAQMRNAFGARLKEDLLFDKAMNVLLDNANISYT